VQPIFGLLDPVTVFSRDIDLLVVTALSVGWTISIRWREWRWKIYRRVCCRFNQLNILAVSATNHLVHGKVDLGAVDNPTKL